MTASPPGTMPGELRYAIVGGGISGLAAALRLVEAAGQADGAAPRIAIFEAGSRPGGQVRTERAGDLVLEAGPDQFVTHKPAALDLCRRVGLDGEIRSVGATEARVLRAGRVVSLPAGTVLVFPTRLGPLLRSRALGWWGRLRAAAEPFVRAAAEPASDESWTEFATRRYGLAWLEQVVEPVVGGIFTADVDRLSVEMTFPGLRRTEREHGSLRRGLGAARRAGRRDAPGLASLRGGLGRLVEALVARLPPGTLRLQAAVRSLERREDGRWRLALADGSTAVAGAVILACPAWETARLLAWDPAIAGPLGELPHAGVATVNLAYPRSALARPLDGLGFFVPRSARLPVLACSYVSRKFPDRADAGVVVLRAFVGGVRSPELLEASDEELAAVVHRSLAGVLAIEGLPASSRVFRAARSMPQFPVGYPERLAEVARRAREHRGLFLASGAVGAVGLPDCVASGERAAEQAMRAPSSTAEDNTAGSGGLGAPIGPAGQKATAGARFRA